MVEWTESGIEREIGEATSDRAATLGDLIGVCQVKLEAVREAGRAEGEFPSSNQGLGDCEGEEDIGGANVVVVQKIGDVGLEGIGVEDPSAVRDGDAVLMFFVALPGKRQETAVRWLTLLDERTGDGFDRGCLIVVSVESAEGPVQTGDGESRAEAWLDGGFRDRRRQRGGSEVTFRESRGPDPGRESEPGKGVELVVDIKSFQIGGGLLGVDNRQVSTAVIEDSAEELIIALIEPKESDLKIVLAIVCLEAGLPSEVG